LIRKHVSIDINVCFFYFLSLFIAANDRPINATFPNASPIAPREVRKPPE
jgi:predicted membrane-bound dolichyl-phosphate-mannose-protein mannosyltransferase